MSVHPATSISSRSCGRSWFVVAPLIVATLAGCGERTGEQAVPHVRVVEAGAVYVGSQAQFSDLGDLDSLGLATVVDLDREHVGAPAGRVARDWEIARHRGLRFVHLPLDPLLPPSLAELDAAVAILSDAWVQPVLVHADRGAERVAMVVAAYRIAQHGWSAERAFAEMADGAVSRTRLDAWRQRLAEFAAARRSRDPVEQSRPGSPGTSVVATARAASIGPPACCVDPVRSR